MIQSSTFLAPQPSAGLRLLQCPFPYSSLSLCCFPIEQSFRGNALDFLTRFFSGIGSSALRPTLNLEDQGPFCRGYHTLATDSSFWCQEFAFEHHLGVRWYFMCCFSSFNGHILVTSMYPTGILSTNSSPVHHVLVFYMFGALYRPAKSRSAVFCTSRITSCRVLLFTTHGRSWL